jgi:hypothetical protein
MSLAQSLRPTLTRLAALAGILGLPLLAGCAYEDGYYDPSPGYGPGYGYDYGYGGYGYDYGYGGYGYNYGHYGSPCWPYGCDDWHHRHRHHHDGDDDNDSHHHRHGGDDGMNDPRFDPNRHAGNFPRQPQQPNPGSIEPRGPGRGAQSPSSPNPIWIPAPRDSRR